MSETGRAAPANKGTSTKFPLITRDMVRRWLSPFELPDWEESTLAAALSILALEWGAAARWRVPGSRELETEARGRRIAEALAVVAKELPEFIEAHDRGRTRVRFVTMFNVPEGTTTKPLPALEKLRSATAALLLGLNRYLEHAGRERWHALARQICWTLRHYGGGAFPRKTQLFFVSAALGALGVSATSEAIRKALR